MNHRNFETRPMGPGRYLERLSKALPGKGWSRASREFWPDSAKLVIAVSFQFGAGSLRTIQAEAAEPSGWYDYGFKEGIPRLLDVFQRRHVRVTSHMVRDAVECNSQLAREIVERGHEAAACDAEVFGDHKITANGDRKECEALANSIQHTTGTRPLGFSRSIGARILDLEILQDLGFGYHSDDVSRDEPFLITVAGKPFVVVPYAPNISESNASERPFLSSDQYASELKNQFEMLYSESETRRRMMSFTLQGRIIGQPARAKALEEFIIYAQRRPGVVFMRKDEIARFALSSALTPREEELKKGREAA